MDVVSHHWDPSSETKECLPYYIKCCQQAAGSWQPHLGAASAKESCLSQGHVSIFEQATCNDWLLPRHQSLPPLPQLRATLKGHLSNRVPVGLTRAYWGLCWDCTWLRFSFFPVLLPSSPFHGCWSQVYSLINTVCANLHPRVSFSRSPLGNIHPWDVSPVSPHHRPDHLT